MIEVSSSNGITTLRLAHGKASALDLELVEALELAIGEVAQSDARAVVITGTGAIFSAGVDLFRLTHEGRPYIERFLPALSRMALALFTLPKPLITSINGHAIAGGGIIGMMGDMRLMAYGNGRMGVPELLVGVAFPPAIVEIIRHCAGTSAQHLMFTGRTYLADDAQRYGMIDLPVPAEELAQRTAEVAEQLASLPPRAFALLKRQLREEAVHRAKRYMHEFESDVAELWWDPATIDAVRVYLAKTVKRQQ
ncbi:MAG TPA: enoyl-CoA hydratase/isomerase family protein [Thermoanaerobaculia bacterium]|nr:enoyl-CoA hydratase/isomerase family protein [Thermoanaerobaculia bacterium]